MEEQIILMSGCVDELGVDFLDTLCFLGEASLGDASGGVGWTMVDFLLSVFFILNCHLAETRAQNNSTTNSSNELMFLSDGKYCRLFPKAMEANQSLSECEINVEDYKYWVEGFLLAIVSFVGILGNFASCVKFAKCQSFYTEQMLKLTFTPVKKPNFSTFVGFFDGYIRNIVDILQLCLLHQVCSTEDSEALPLSSPWPCSIWYGDKIF